MLADEDKQVVHDLITCISSSDENGTLQTAKSTAWILMMTTKYVPFYVVHYLFEAFPLSKARTRALGLVLMNVQFITPPRDEPSLLSMAVQSGDAECVAMMLQIDRSIFACAKNGLSPVGEAIITNQTQVLNQLLSANNRYTQPFGNRELLLAVFVGNETAVTMLLEAGCSKAFLQLEYHVELHTVMLGLIHDLSQVGILGQHSNIAKAFAIYKHPLNTTLIALLD